MGEAQAINSVLRNLFCVTMAGAKFKCGRGLSLILPLNCKLGSFRLGLRFLVGVLVECLFCLNSVLLTYGSVKQWMESFGLL